MKTHYPPLFAVAIVALITACGPSPDEIAATVRAQIDQEETATAAALPTNTPTATSTPTSTSTPTNTPTPTPVPTSVLLPDTQVLQYVEFDHQPQNWNFMANVHMSDGVATLSPSEDWDGIFTEQNLLAGQTVLITYQFEPNTEGQLAVETGHWGTASYRAWGVINNYGYLVPNVEDGETGYFVGWGSGNIAMVPDQWYVVAMYIGSSDEVFRIRLWALDDPSVAMEQHYTLSAPANSRWNSKMTNAPTGSAMVDRWELIDGWPWPD